MTLSAINLDRLPAPTIIDQPTFEAIFDARKARLIELAPDLEAALQFESEPLVRLLQEDAYREVLLRAAVQDAGKGNLLAFATGAMLEHLAAFYGVERQIVVAADPDANPPIVEETESDDRLRARVQLSPEGFSTAGSAGSYKFWALSASASVKDVAVLQTATPGEVRLVVLSADGDGSADPALLQAVDDVTRPRRPLNDTLIINAGAIQPYTINATLTLYDGPDAALVQENAIFRAQDFVSTHHRLGHDIALSGIYAALHGEGVQNVALHSPTADIVIPSDQAAYCTSIAVTIGGRDV